jgi:hypothetical protein
MIEKSRKYSDFVKDAKAGKLTNFTFLEPAYGKYNQKFNPMPI